MSNNSIYRPHPRSKLAFAFQASATIDQALEATKNCPAQTLYEDLAAAERDGNPGVAARLKYRARNAEPIDDAWRSVARDELFPPPERPGSVADEARVDKHAKVLRAAAGLREAGVVLCGALEKSGEPQKRESRENSKPSKSFVDGLIAGCYFSLPNDRHLVINTARALSDGIPSGGKHLGVSRANVRSHLAGFVQSLVWRPNRAVLTCRYHVLRWRRVEYLWSQSGARRSSMAVAKLIESGQIFSLLDVFEDSDDFTGATRAAIGDLTRRIITELEKARDALHKCA